MDLEALAARLSGGRLFHSYIITGSSPGERERAAGIIARAAVCSGHGPVPCGVCRDCQKAMRGVHPDIIEVRRKGESREIGVDVMRSVRARASVMPNEAAKSVYIIFEADTMNLQAQNAMLKVFEEPPPHAVFLLLAENPQRLLPTVLSRCETVTLTPERQTSETDSRVREVLAAYAREDNSALLRALLPVETMGRRELPEFLDGLRREALRLGARDGGLPEGRLAQLSDTLDEAEKLTGVNVSAGHVAGMMLAELMTLD